MVTLRFALGVLQTLAIVLAFVASGLLAAVTVRSCATQSEVQIDVEADTIVAGNIATDGVGADEIAAVAVDAAELEGF